MYDILVVEDNARLRPALVSGLDATGKVRVLHACASGEETLAWCREYAPQAILMDVQLAGEMNGIEAAVAIRREYPRMPVVFYSIQDDDAYFRANGLMLRNPTLINFLDGCALSIPCHESGTAPVGLMVAGPALSDQRILSVGLAIEACLSAVLRR